MQYRARPTPAVRLLLLLRQIYRGVELRNHQIRKKIILYQKRKKFGKKTDEHWHFEIKNLVNPIPALLIPPPLPPPPLPEREGWILRSHSIVDCTNKRERLFGEISPGLLPPSISPSSHRRVFFRDFCGGGAWLVSWNKSTSGFAQV